MNGVSAANLALQVVIRPCCFSGRHCPYVPGSSGWRSRPVDSVLENPRGFRRGCWEFGAQGLGQESNPEAKLFPVLDWEEVLLGADPENKR